MNVEERIRTGTKARADLVRDIRPLDLPAAQPLRLPRLWWPRGWSAWAAPVTAAAVVVALAITLVALRQARGEPSVPVTAPTTAAAAPAVPGYYAEVAAPTSVVVGDDRTGRLVSAVSAPAGVTFAGVTAGADDRTFVLDAQAVSGGTHSWYLLRVAPGSSRRAELSRLPIAAIPNADEIEGLALSPDASRLAVLYQLQAHSQHPGQFTLGIYSIATGQAVRTWTTPGLKTGWFETSAPNADNQLNLTWMADGRTLAFLFPPFTWPDYERRLNVNGTGADLLAGSRSILAVPGDVHKCAGVLLAADGRTTICGTLANATHGCRQLEPEFDLYPAATGKLAEVLYRYRAGCSAAEAFILWASSGGSAIGAIEAFSAVKGTNIPAVHVTFGLLTPGKLTPLRVRVPAHDFYTPGTIAF
jgi:hypothetical protein